MGKITITVLPPVRQPGMTQASVVLEEENGDCYFVNCVALPTPPGNPPHVEVMYAPDAEEYLSDRYGDGLRRAIADAVLDSAGPPEPNDPLDAWRSAQQPQERP